MQLLLILSASFAAEQTELMQYKIDSNQYSQALGDTVSQPGSNIMVVFQDSKYRYWFGMSLLGTFRYDGKTFDWISEPDLTELHGGPANGVRSIIEDREGYFWFNSEYRYKVFDRKTIGTESFYERHKSIGSLDGNKEGNMNEYLSITKDNDNNLWIATYRNGVWKYDGKEIRHYSIQENGKDINLFYIYNDKIGNIWLGTHQNGVWKLKGEIFERFIP